MKNRLVAIIVTVSVLAFLYSMTPFSIIEVLDQAIIIIISMFVYFYSMYLMKLGENEYGNDEE